MSSPTNLGQMDASAWKQLQNRAERLDALWQERGGPVDLNELLPPANDSTRPAILVELIKTDLELRWRHNFGVRLDWYVERFEELGSVSELSARLIYEEYRVRQLHGDKPDLSSYKRRFPRQFPELENLVKTEPIGTVSPIQPTPVTLSPAAKPPPEMTRNNDSGIMSNGYRLIERISSGSFGEVWKAEAPGGINVAVKVIFKPVGSDADQHEKRAIDKIKNLSHPALLSTHAYWIDADRRLHIAMELADGTTRDRLKDCLARGQRGIPAEELLRMMMQSAEALDYVHSEGLFHRDIKPDNILLKKGYAKVGDFSLVRKQDTMSVDSQAAGTLAYMGPECYKGNVGRQSDQYSLAVTYFELRTNKRPFPTRTGWYEAMMDAVEGAPDLSPLEGAELAVLQKAMAKDPNDRYSTCMEFVEALERVVKGTQPKAPTDVPQSWIAPNRRVGPEGYLLLQRLTGTSTVGQYWEAVAAGGRHVALQIIENLDRGGVLRYLQAYNLARCLSGVAHVLQMHSHWFADANGAERKLAEVFNSKSEERVTMIVVQELAYDDVTHHLGGSHRALPDDRLPQLITYLKQAASAIDYINSCSHTYMRRQVAIRHCAVRPENLLLVDDEVKVACFDLAQESVEPVEPLRCDSADLEPGYAAPELLERGGGNVTPFSDQYSLAMTYVKLRTGSLPFNQSQSSHLLIEEQLAGRLNLKNLSEAEREIITKATSRKPEDRYPNCVAFIEALDAAAQNSRGEIVIEPDSRRPIDAPTLQKHQETLPPPIERRTPPPTPHWKIQGGGTPASDVTLMPGQLKEAMDGDESVFLPNVSADVRERPVEPRRHEREPRRKKPGAKSARLIAVCACISAVALIVAIYFGTRKPPERSLPPDDSKGQTGNGTSTTAGLQTSTGQTASTGSGTTTGTGQTTSTESGTTTGQSRPSKTAEFHDSLAKFSRAVKSADWQVASNELVHVRTEWQTLSTETRDELKTELEPALRDCIKNLDKLIDAPQSSVDINGWVSEIKKFANGSLDFDLNRLDCRAYARKANYQQFFVTLTSFTESQTNGRSTHELLTLFANFPATAGNKSVNLTKMLDEYREFTKRPEPEHRVVGVIQQHLADLIAVSVNELVKLSYAGLIEPKNFEKMLEYTRLLAYDKAGPNEITVACHAECLLCQYSKGIAERKDEGFASASSLAKNEQLINSMEAYPRYVRGLICRVEGDVLSAADHFKEAFKNKDDWWNPSRLHLAADTLFQAGKSKRSAGNRNEALDYMDSAERLLQPKGLSMVDELTCLETAFEAANSHSRIASRLDRLLKRADFKNLTESGLAPLGRTYADWADRNEPTAEGFTARLGKALASASKQKDAADAAYYWLGIFYWKNGERREAEQAFGDALARCDTKQLFSSKVGHLGKEGRLGRIKEFIKFDDKDDESTRFLVSVINSAIQAIPNDEGERRWALIVKRDWLIVNNQKQLADDLAQDNPKFLDDADDIVSNNKDRPYLRALAHKYVITAVFYASKLKLIKNAKQQTKLLEAHKAHAIKWAKLFLEAGPDIFDQWRGALEDAKDCVDILHNYGQKDADLKKLGDDLEKKCNANGGQPQSPRDRTETHTGENAS